MLKRLQFKKEYNHHFEYTKDINRIIKIFADRGYEIFEPDAVYAWENVSRNWAAGWLSLHDADEEIFQDCFKYLEEA